MKNKNIISLTIGFAFLSIAITGILLYIKQKAHAVEITHTVFGLIFIGFAIFHIINNWSSITGYSKDRKSGKVQKELVVAASIFGIILIGGITGILEPVAEAGRIFAKPRPKRPEALSFEEVKTNQDTKGTSLKILIEKNKDTELPVITAWVEDSAHNFVENLFVPAKIANMPKDEEAAKEGHFEIVDFKPEALATWQNKASIKTANFDKETPHDNFVLKTNTIAKGNYFVVLAVKSKDVTELYEASVNSVKGDVFKLKAKENTLLSSVLVEL
jgi:Domain of unknown function (DUF4405)